MDYDIHKAAGIIIRDRKILIERSYGKDTFMAPGGKLEQGETPSEAAIRELKEEFQLDVKASALSMPKPPAVIMSAKNYEWMSSW